METSLRACVDESGGAVIEELLGDGLLAVFTSAGPALECRRALRRRREGVGLGLHVGLHAGDVIREGSNIFGGAVNLAARVAGEAPAGVLASETVRALARTAAPVVFADRGERRLKEFAEPVRLYAVIPADPQEVVEEDRFTIPSLP